MRQDWLWMACAAGLFGCFGSDGQNPVGPGVTGGQTGDEGAIGRESGGDTLAGPLAFCEDAEPVALELDEESPLGFRPSEALALAEGTHESTLHWGEQSAFPYGPESGQGTLTLTVTPQAGARYVQSQPKDMGGGEIAVDCPSRVEIDVEVSVVSGGGALDERFDAVLVSSDGHLARIEHTLDVEALGGSLRFELPTDRDVRVYSLSLSMLFSPYGSSGTLQAGFEERTADAVSEFAMPPLASWPTADSCETGGVPVPYDPADAPSSARAAVDAVNALPAAALTGGAMDTEVTLALEHDGGAVCADLGSFFGEPATGALMLGGVLHVVAADGSLDASFDVAVRAVPDDTGALAAVELELDYRDPCAEWNSTTPLDERCADFGVDLSDYDGAHLQLNVRVDLAGEPTVRGTLAVVGELAPDCVTNPPEPQMGADGSVSSPGCPGIDTRTVLELSIGD